jgi:hypothetical protein
LGEIVKRIISIIEKPDGTLQVINHTKQPRNEVRRKLLKIAYRLDVAEALENELEETR